MEIKDFGFISKPIDKLILQPYAYNWFSIVTQSAYNIWWVNEALLYLPSIYLQSYTSWKEWFSMNPSMYRHIVVG